MSVTILYQGRRERVPMEPSKPMITAVEAYCAKQGLDSSKYALMSGKSLVDLSLPFRLSSVANNAVLELVLRSSSGSSSNTASSSNNVMGAGGGGSASGGDSVRIALTIAGAGADRIQNSFMPSNTLAEVLIASAKAASISSTILDKMQSKATNDNNDKKNNPFEGCSIVYMRTQVSGNDLVTTTLSSMGILRGAVSLRATIPGVAESSPSSSSASATAAAITTTSSNAAPLPSSPPTPAAAVASAVTASVASISSSSPLKSVPESPTITHHPNVAASATTSTSSITNNVMSTPFAFPPTSSSSSSSSSFSFPTTSTTATTTTTTTTTATEPIQRPAFSMSNAATKSATTITSTSDAYTTNASSSSSSSATANTSDVGEDSFRTRVKASGAKVRTAISKIKFAAFDADAIEAFTTLVKMLDAVVSRPGDTRVRTIRLNNATFHAKAGKWPGAIDVLKAAGFTDDIASGSGESVITLRKEDENDDITLGVREMVALEANSLGARLPPAPEPDTSVRASMQAEALRVEAAFDPFKPMLLKMDVDSNMTPTGGGSGGSSSMGGAARPQVKILSGGSSSSSGSSGGSGSGIAGGVFNMSGASSSSTTTTTSGSSSSSSSNIDLMSLADPGIGALTALDRKVLALKARAMEIRANAGPVERGTQIRLYDPSGSFVAGRFSAVEASGGGGGSSSSSSSSSSSQQQQQGGGGGGDGGEDSSFGADGSGGGASTSSSSVWRASETTAAEDTSGDARLQMEYLRKKMKAEKEKEEGFRTKAMRDLEILQKAKVYTSTMIRVQTPDRTVFQALFSPSEPVSSIHAWVRGLLIPMVDAVSSGNTGACAGSGRPPFYLYSTPPPTLLQEDDEKSLADAKLQPAILLYLGWGTGPTAKALDAPTEASAFLTADAYNLAKSLGGSNESNSNHGGGGGSSSSSSSSSRGGGADVTMYPTSTPLVEEPTIDIDAAAAAMLAGQTVNVGAVNKAGSANTNAKMPAWASKMFPKK